MPDPNDRRGVLVKLTNRGQVIADEAAVMEAEAEEAFIVDISDAEPGSMSYTLRAGCPSKWMARLLMKRKKTKLNRLEQSLQILLGNNRRGLAP